MSAYQTVAYLGKGDELLVSWGAHVEADGQHLLQGSYDQRGLDGIVLASTALVFPLLVPPGLQRERRRAYSVITRTL